MVDFLQTITSSLKGALSSFEKKPDSVIGIDIGGSSIKVVQLKKEGGKIVLETYGAVSLGPYADQESGQLPNLDVETLATAIQDVLTEAHTTTMSTGFSIQSGASLIFMLDLPHVKESEYAKIVPTEARKYIPVPLSEVSLDWWVVPENEYEGETAKRSQVLVVAVRNDTLQQYRDIVTAMPITSKLYELEIFSIIRSSFNHELEPIIVLDMGARSTRIAIIEYGVVRSFQTVNRGSHQISKTLATSLNISFDKAEALKKKSGIHESEEYPEAQKVINSSLRYIFSEVNSVLLDYEKEYHKTIGAMYLSGGGVNMPGFTDELRKEFKFPVSIVDPFAKTVYPDFLKNILTESGPDFAVAAGVALKQL